MTGRASKLRAMTGALLMCVAMVPVVAAGLYLVDEGHVTPAARRAVIASTHTKSSAANSKTHKEHPSL